MKTAIVMGTRPEIVKMSPVIKEYERQELDYFILHTGQHYSYNMDGMVFKTLDLPSPKYNLQIGSGTYADEVSRAINGMDILIGREKPDIILVEGDTNAVIASALVSMKIGVKLGHIEAGLRSYFSGMPEEINRVLTDHCSDYLFAPTEKSVQTLIDEGISPEKIYLTGNTIVDVVKQYACNEANDENFMLLTLHRQENVDDISKFRLILKGIEQLKREYKMPILYPVHPRSKKMIENAGIELDIDVIDPVDYISFLRMECHASLILTDSGGVQEEACILGVPCVTLRDNTERPETIEIGANMLAGTSPERIMECAKLMIGKRHCWSNPFGDGKAAEKIVKIIRRHHG